MEKGVIFDITHGSFVDGPGIRTTVFFKGCNLACKWCHNPESQSFVIQKMKFEDKCTGCGLCQKACNAETCTLCGKCSELCPNKSIVISGKHVTAREVFEIICKDKAFYGNANDKNAGGVTFSGGECMLQIDFLQELLVMCKEAGISTAVDTAGHVKWEFFEKILDKTDLFLFDVKSMNAEIHQKMTGHSNERILKNLAKLLQLKKRVWVRVPVIPGVNDSEEEILHLADFLKKHGIPEKIELMAYHTLGIAKYQALGMQPTQFHEPEKETMERLETILKKELEKN